ncbi:MAG TPA: branched-chain amino acid ABC transporter permease [Chloroflexota bacterium]|jgi:branched-chain amino acid transport system permease protein|nr:branched-chain amino acid ABC transporter permease [Chloroflexota bacterium]
MMGMSGRWQALALAAVVAAVVVVPWAGTGYVRSLVVLSGLAVVAVAGLALLVGFAGQLSLAQGAFYGLGAYGFAVLAVRFGWPAPLALLGALAGVGLAGWLVGLPMLRLRGHFLALGTLAFAVIVTVLLLELGPLTGGPSGLAGVPSLRRVTIGPLALSGEIQYCYVAWALALASLWLYQRLIRSEVGLALQAMSSSEVGTAAMGIDVGRLKLSVFVAAALLGGLAGAVYASYLSFISPAAFDIMLSVQLVVMVMVGGTATFWGPLLGALVVTGLVEVLRGVVAAVLPNVRGPVEIIALGLVLGLIMVWEPGGLVARLGQWRPGPRPAEVPGG